jgi:amino acid transporter
LYVKTIIIIIIIIICVFSFSFRYRLLIWFLASFPSPFYFSFFFLE